MLGPRSAVNSRNAHFGTEMAPICVKHGYMDWQQVAAEWICALRGRRSQRAASKRLGYGSNIVYRWEARLCAPPATTAFTAAQRFGVNVEESIATFLGVPDADRSELPDFTTRDGIVILLERLRGDLSFVELAKRTTFNRFTLSRWFRGAAEPKLPELLQLVEVTTRRLLDFIASFTDPAKLPSLRVAWRKHRALRDAAFDAPWSHAVLRCLELRAYQQLPRHQAGWIASRIGISLQEEQRCLELLRESEQVALKDGRWTVVKQATVDTGQEPTRARELRRFWLQQALTRFEANARGAFGYNLFTVSDKDYDALRTLYVQYFESMRSLIAESSPGERLVLFCGQLLELDGNAKGSEP